MSTTFSGGVDSIVGRSEEMVLLVLEHMIWPILLLLSLAIAVLVPQTFRNVTSIELVLFGSVPLGLLVLAESICLLSGHFDLSIGAIAGFSAMFTGMLLGTCPSCWGVISNPYLGFLIVLATGTLIGVTNGVMISKLGLNPFLQTLAFLIIFEGAKTALNTQPVSGLPDLYIYPGSESAIAIGTLFAAFVVFAVIMRYTRFGQSVYALGSDQDSARAVGISTDRVIIAVYALSGFLAGLAGLMSTGFTGVVAPGIGEGLVFPAFAAAVIGGISLFGGRGKIFGALGGVILLGLLQAALNISGVPATQIRMANGIVLLIAILLYNTKENIRARILASGA
jgi:ribose/xylose/arabinose/galactoside ABC-type transport system permease subunit